MKNTTLSLAEFGVEAMTIYADEVNLGRAVPDLMDGLKPVQRRIMYAASNLGKEFVKTARTVGEVLGKYHAHGDSSVSGAIEVMVQANVPVLRGRGNWGGLIDSAAAMRYTNMTLSDFGHTFFDPHYIAKEVTMFVPNYDDTTVEPVTLPAMLPNVLFTAAEGIGVGTTTMLPPFTPESVVKAMEMILRGENDPLALSKVMKLSNKWGGHLVKDKVNIAEYRKLFTSSQGKVRYAAELTVDNKTKSIEISDWPPGLNPIKFIEKVRTFPECASALNHTGALGFRIECNSSYNLPQFEKFVEKVRKATITTRAYKMNVTVREASINDGVVTFKTDYRALSVPGILTEWLKRRLVLERKSLTYRQAQQAKAIAYTKLLIHAADNLSVIFDALKRKDSAAYIAKNLRISDEEAKQILELRVRQLSSLDKENCKSTLKKQQAHLAELEAWYKKPKAKIMADANDALLRIQSDRKFVAEKARKLEVK